MEQQRQSLLSAQALAGLELGASAPPNPATFHVEHQVTRDSLNPIGLVQGGLVELGVPAGLAKVVAEDDQRIGLRVYLLDNSGSTSASDGNLLLEAPGASSGSGAQRMTKRSCTRWEEICAFAEDHARWNLKVGTPCEFILLNSLGRPQGAQMVEGRDCLHVEASRGGEQAQVQELRQLLRDNGPRGVTPITVRLQDIRFRIERDFAALAQRRQMIFLTIVTDGLPTSPVSGESTQADKKCMVEAMRSLCATLPLQLVIRLCTDDESTIRFYNSIDEELEFPLDILDDMTSEAQEVASNGNDWFAYTPVLHRIREAGTLSKILDAIDERSLADSEVQQLAELLSGSQQPLAHLGKREFIREIKKIVARSPLVWDARREEMRPIIDISRLRIALRYGFRGRCLPYLCPFLF